MPEFLCLLIQNGRRKPFGMNTSTRISFASVLLVGIAVALCLSACPNKGEMADNNDKTFYLKIGNPSKGIYLDIKNQDDFDKALIKVKDNGGDFKITYLCKEGANAQSDYDPKHHESCDKSAQSAESEMANRVAAGDPNATQHVRVANPDDLAAVLATFATPAPAAAH